MQIDTEGFNLLLLVHQLSYEQSSDEFVGNIGPIVLSRSLNVVYHQIFIGNRGSRVMSFYRVFFASLLAITVGCSDGEVQNQIQPAAAAPAVVDYAASLLTFSEVKEKIETLSYFSDSTFTMVVDEKAQIVCQSDDFRSWISNLLQQMGATDPDSPFMPKSQVNDWIERMIAPWLDSAKSAGSLHSGCRYSLVDKTGGQLRVKIDEDFFYQCDADNLKAVATVRAIKGNMAIVAEPRPLDLLIRDQEMLVTQEAKQHLSYLAAYGDAYQPNVPDYIRNANCKPNKSARAARSKSLIKKN